MYGTYVICENELFVEGRSIGPVTSFSVVDNKDTVLGTCTIKLPIYMVGIYDVGGQQIINRQRINLDSLNIKVGAYVELFAGYKNDTRFSTAFPRLSIFRGYIRNISNGMPATIECEDLGFPLRFGSITKTWNGIAKLSSMLKLCVDEANRAFGAFREAQGLSVDFQKLSVAPDIAESEFYLTVWREARPIQGVEVLKNSFWLYAYVRRDASVYVGIGIDRGQAPAGIQLTTKLNVIDRNIVADDRMFTDYTVFVNGVDSTGKRIEASAGVGTPKTGKTTSSGKDEASQVTTPQGETYRVPFTRLRTQSDLDALARRVLKNLQGARNEGTITTLLYPEVNLFDVINYEDTVYTNLSGRYYVTARTVEGGAAGYRQRLTVTNETFKY